MDNSLMKEIRANVLGMGSFISAFFVLFYMFSSVVF